MVIMLDVSIQAPTISKQGFSANDKSGHQMGKAVRAVNPRLASCAAIGRDSPNSDSQLLRAVSCSRVRKVLNFSY